MGREAILVYDSSTGEDLLVGRVWFNGMGSRLSSTFTYADEWLSSAAVYSLAPDVPLSASRHVTRPIPGFLEDSSPDRWGRRLVSTQRREEDLAAGRQPRALDERDYLLGVSDAMRMGSLRVSEDEGGPFLSSTSTIPRLVSLPHLVVSARSMERGGETASELKALLSAGSGSIGGARPKAMVMDGDELLLAKFPGVNDEWDVMRWEGTALDLADRAGIPTPSHRLLSVGGDSVLLEARFDRGSGARRVPYMSAMTLLAAHDGQQKDYADIADALTPLAVDAHAEVLALFRRIALSVAINNTDDHLRNHGLLRIGGGWTLSPLFDVNPNPYPDDRETSIYGRTGPDTSDALADFASAFDIPVTERDSVIEEVLVATGGWRRVADRNGVPDREVALMAPSIRRGRKTLAAVSAHVLSVPTGKGIQGPGVHGGSANDVRDPRSIPTTTDTLTALDKAGLRIDAPQLHNREEGPLKNRSR